MENITAFNRTEEVQRAKEDSDRSDLKQHADKMLRDFEKFNDFSSNRAIWELVQNACDLTVNCEVIIDYRDNKFSFTHNGKPFTSNSLISLIKQVSGDKDENSEIPPVGKYGTGFLTTHSLGRKFLLNSILQTSSGHFIEIKDFLIDRSPKKWEDLSDKIREQKDKVFEIINNSGEIIENPIQRTTFTYLPETVQENLYVTQSYHDLEEYIPLVLTINDRLKLVKIISKDGKQIEFTLTSKEEVSSEEDIILYKTSIKKNGDDKEVYSIADTNLGIEIILPIDKDLTLFEFSDRVARLFLYYPLIGTEDFGINFIINCNQFLPTEPRNGLHLASNKDQVKDQEEVNKELIEKASELLFKFLNSNILPVKNPLLYARINFKRNSDDLQLNKYFSDLQEQWVNNFKNLDIVETKDGYKKVTEVTFLDPGMLEKDEYFECIYYLFDKFYSNIPNQNTIRYWSTYVNDWEYKDANFVTNEDFAKEIQQCTLADFDNSLLKKYYEYLLEEKHNDLFTDYELLPNIDGDFQYLNYLKLAQDIDVQLIDIGKIVIPDSVSQLINPGYSFGFKLEGYNRRDFSNDINTTLNVEFTDSHICLPEAFNDEGYLPAINKLPTLQCQYFLSVLNYCKLHNKLNSQSKPTKLMAIISEYYNVAPELNFINSIDDKENDIDVRQAQKRLVKVFFNTLLQHHESWVESNINLLYDIALCNEDRFKEVYSTAKIYPSQLYELNTLTDLKKGVDLDPYITNLYNRTSNKLIEGSVAHSIFNEFLIENDEVTNKILADAIEHTFFETDIRDINEHPYKDDIINIISKLNTTFYKELFLRLDDKKANLMLDVVTNENTKDDIFAIVTLEEEQLKKLGRIVQQPNFEKILTEAEDAIRIENERKSDFQHKFKIGTYIEDKIRENLNETLASKFSVYKGNLSADDVQGGQDIIIYYDNQPLYYIEVKSRWNTKNSVSLSKPQLERATDNFDKYSLVSVDVTKYEGNNDKYNLTFDEIIPLIRVIDNIGESIGPLITNNLIAERDQSYTVKLIDYRGIVNQQFINGGAEFEHFSDKLVSFLTQKISDCHNSYFSDKVPS